MSETIFPNIFCGNFTQGNAYYYFQWTVDESRAYLALEGNFLVDTRERVGHGGQEEDDHAEDRVGRVVIQQLRNQRDHNARNDQRGTGVVRPTVAAELMTLADWYIWCYVKAIGNII